MRLIVGLGNPGDRYRDTRHNLGHLLLEELCRRNRCREERREQGCLVRPCRIGPRETLLARTRTFMNTSGPAVRDLVQGNDLKPRDLLLAYDDVDLELGRIKIKKSGSSGGHRGVESVMAALGGGGFARLRLGLGRPPGRKDTADWVLEPFEASERPLVEAMLDRAAEATECAVVQGLSAAMNRYNRRPPSEAEVE